MPDWDGNERRKISQVHVVCAKEHEWGGLRQSLLNIESTQKRIEKNQETILREIFGNGHEGLKITSDRNKQSIRRVWWWLGGVSLAFVVGMIGVLFEHFKGGQ